MADSKVKAVISHNQEIDGKSYTAGDQVALSARLARVLAARGSIQLQQKDAAKATSAQTKETSK